MTPARRRGLGRPEPGSFSPKFPTSGTSTEPLRSRLARSLLTGRSQLFNLVLLGLSISALAATGIAASYVLSGVRAYVGGEGLWSKAEKSAVFHLAAYVQSRRDDDFLQAMAALAVPLGDHRARLALEREDFDRRQVGRDLRTGRNHPADVASLIWLFRHFRHVEAFDRAVGIWQRGDLYIEQLQDLAREVRRESLAGPLPAARQGELLRRIGGIDGAVTELEDDFSFTLGDLARRVHRLLVLLMIGAAALLLAGAWLLSVRLGRLLRREEEALRHSEQRYRNLVETSSDLIWSVDLAGRWTFVNQVVRRIHGYEPAEMLGRPVGDFQTPEQAASDRAAFDRLLGGQAVVGHETVHLRRDGRPVHLLLSAVALRDGRGRVIGATGTAADVTAQRRAERFIRHQAYHDPLTGLPNRALFLERLGRALDGARRSGSELAVFFLDLDRFKLVNDTLGHSAGDRLLRAVAGRLRAVLRAEDMVARFGGDEFTVLLLSRAPVEVAAVVRKLIARVTEPLDLDGQRLKISTSVGIATFPGDGEDADALIRNADLALYHAKELGRDGYQVCTPAMKTRAAKRAALESELRQAVERQELRVLYQPVVNVADGTTAGLEALVRWRHPRQGLVLPSQFMAMAEELRLVVPISDWVLRTACRQLREWQEGGDNGLRMAVNLSASHFERADGAAAIGRQLQDTGLAPSCLDLEITESAAMRDVTRTIDSLRRLRDLGCRIAMDDFGAGQTSLGNLRRLPLDTLKIDQCLVRDIGSSKRAEVLLSSVVEMAHGLGLETVAEGVERADQLAFLQACGCDRYQGFLFSRPLPAGAASALVRVRGAVGAGSDRRRQSLRRVS
jgi:diguanylate cyclase (GGDEF)-like protein/PAS domain S-box-containing protein